jgi:hypothetical protein
VVYVAYTAINKGVIMAVFAITGAGALLFARWVPHTPQAGDPADPNYKDGYLRYRQGSSISPRMAEMILKSRTVHRMVLTSEFRATPQERAWILEALTEWRASGFGPFKKLYE